MQGEAGVRRPLFPYRTCSFCAHSLSPEQRPMAKESQSPESSWVVPDFVQVRTPFMTLTDCVPVGKSFNCSQLHFPPLQDGENGNECSLWAEWSQTNSNARKWGRDSVPEKQLAETQENLGMPRGEAEVAD